jgi:hypothetical protein
MQGEGAAQLSRVGAPSNVLGVTLAPLRVAVRYLREDVSKAESWLVDDHR